MTDTQTDWRTAGVSVAGISHLKAGTPCQDAHRCTLLPGGVVVAAVADGAGSAARAEVGSAVAAWAAVDKLVTLLGEGLPLEDVDWHDWLQEGFQTAAVVVAGEAAAQDCSANDLATTLLLAVATPELVAAGQVGDGAVVARLADDQFHAVTMPANQEYVNETTFLTSAGALDQVQVGVLRAPLTGLALFSDGLQRLALRLPQGTPHAPFFTPLLRFVAQTPDRPTAEEQLRRFLQSSRVAERADDDLTLVLAVRGGG
jgi:hypothetical protein